MKEFFKTILKQAGLYYFLQGRYRQFISYLYKFKIGIAYKKYKGSGLECNCCGAVYSKFVPDYPSIENKNAITVNEVIAGYGDNVLCPACLSTSRDRLIIAMLKSRYTISQNKILHFSPEKNIYNLLKKNNHVITADIIPGFYKIIDKRIKREDATKLSFEDNIFDLVIGNHILEHIPDDIKAMKEIYRVLKPGGYAILQVPYSTKLSNTIEQPGINDPELQSELFGQKDHVRIYQLQNYISRLKQCGFKVEVIEYKNINEFYKYAIQPNEDFIVIQK